MKSLGDKYYANEELTKEERKLVNAGPYRINRAKCLKCNEIITSTHRHDYVQCECKNLAVDGGSWYLRRAFHGDGKDYEDLSELYQDVDPDNIYG